MSEKKEYVVTTTGLHLNRKEKEKGTTIELTDKQAASLVNKVQLKSKFLGAAKGSSEEVQKVKTKLEKSEATVEDLTTKLETVTAELTETKELLDGDAEAELVLLKTKIDLYEGFKVNIGETFDDPDIIKLIKALDKAVKVVK